MTASFGGTSAFAPSSADVAFDVVKATPRVDVRVQPAVIHKMTTSPRLDVTLSAAGQTVTGYVVVRQDGAILGFEQLVDGHTTITLAPYKKKGQQTVSVQYLGSDLAEAVTTPVTFTVQN